MQKAKQALKSDRIASLCIIIFFGGCTLLFFGRVIFGNVYFPIAADFGSFNFPHDFFGATSLQRGDLPLWDPYVAAGQPVEADPNIAYWYPLRLLLMLVVPGFSYREMEYLQIFHYFLTGLFTYLLARDLGASRIGGVFAGVAFMFSGFMVGQMDHSNIIASVTWLPLVFLFLRRAVLTGRYSDSLWSGMFWGLSVLGGHPQFSVMMGLWIGLWVLGRWIWIASRQIFRDLLRLGLAFVVAIALAAIQILPAIELIGESLRGHLTAEEATLSSLPPSGWLLFLMPHFWGLNVAQAQQFWVGLATLNELYGYVGVITLFLAVVGIVVRLRLHPSQQQRYDLWFLVAMAFSALVLAAGDMTPLYGWVSVLVPVLRLVRVPARFLFWFDLSIPLLAAFGIEFIRRANENSARNMWRILVIALIILLTASVLLRTLGMPILTSEQFDWLTEARLSDLNILIALLVGLLLMLWFSRFLKTWRPLLPGMAVALLLLDMFAAQATFSFTVHDPLENFAHPRPIELVKRENGYYRIDNVPEAYAHWESLIGLLYNVPMAFGLPYNPFDLNRFDDYWQATQRDARAYDFLSVKYLVVPKGMELTGKWRMVQTDDPTVDVYENTRALPRVFVVFQSIVEPDRAKMLQMIESDVYNLRQVVFLESGVPMSQPDAKANAQIIQSSNNQVLVQTRSSQNGYLVMSDAYYPGWRVWVDDTEAQLDRANYAFRAAALPAGEHIVRFEFDPVPWHVGLTITLTAMVGLSLIAMVSLMRL
jgi:hypothetical protein